MKLPSETRRAVENAIAALDKLIDESSQEVVPKVALVEYVVRIVPVGNEAPSNDVMHIALDSLERLMLHRYIASYVQTALASSGYPYLDRFIVTVKQGDE